MSQEEKAKTKGFILGKENKLKTETIESYANSG